MAMPILSIPTQAKNLNTAIPEFSSMPSVNHEHQFFDQMLEFKTNRHCCKTLPWLAKLGMMPRKDKSDCFSTQHP